VKFRTLTAALAAAVTLAAAGSLTGAAAAPSGVSGDGGNRIATLRSSGEAYVKEGGLSAQWVKE
jgi:hypothetical protein